MSRPIYRGDNIVKTYQQGQHPYEVLHGLNLELLEGDFTIIVGPSGCGKSTLLYLLFGLEPPTNGKIFYNNQDLFSLTSEQRTKLRRQKMSMVHQQPIWINSLSVAENIAFPLTLNEMSFSKALKIAHQLLDVLNMGKAAKNWPTELSGGEQQRCSFLRSLIINPSVIFADEPTGNLDTDSSTIIMELFRKINEDLGKTIVLVTHNLHYLPYATQTIQMLDGQIISVSRNRPPNEGEKASSVLDVIHHLNKSRGSTAPLVTSSGLINDA